MGLFRRKKTVVAPPETPKVDPIVEIIANREAKAEVAKQAREASNTLNELLVQNGFTIKIYLAAGGHLPTKHKKGLAGTK